MYPSMLLTASVILALGNPTRPDALPNRNKALFSASPPVVTVVVEYRDAQAGSEWAEACTEHFRVFHKGSRELAGTVAETAERTCKEAFHKWFGEACCQWRPRCDIYLHETAQDYALATGVPAAVPGHSTFRFDGGRLVSLRIDLHCDVPTMVSAVLPHEVTHAVLHGMFAEQALPRWANEGMAALAEPPEQIGAQLQQVERGRQAGHLFALQALMESQNYPRRGVAVYYAQSVSLVDFLTARRGPKVFIAFLREAGTAGYEAALLHHYQWTFADLERHWAASAKGDLLISAR